MFLEAGWLVIWIGSLGIIGAIVLGKICALSQYYKTPVLSQITKVYCEFSRNTPLLIQLFFLYYGLPKLGLMLSAEMCGVVGLIFLGGGYFSATFKASYEGVPVGQIEASRSLGLTRVGVFKQVIFPQSLRLATAGIGANVIFLLKETSVFSGIALADLTFVSQELIGMHYNSDEALLMLVVSYSVILIPLVILFTLIERKLRRGQVA